MGNNFDAESSCRSSHMANATEQQEHIAPEMMMMMMTRRDLFLFVFPRLNGVALCTSEARRTRDTHRTKSA